MPLYSQESIENLKARVNIVDVISRDVKLTRAGANYKGLCPFHNEKTPSFVVSEQKQYFTCFGCGERGDVIQYEMKQFNLEFVEAVEKLAKENGIELKAKKTGYNDKRASRYYEINKMAARYFYEAIQKPGNAGHEYMKGRGITDATLKRFGIGYADKDWNSLTDYLRKKGVSDREMLDLGLISESRGKKYDKFRNRVIFPIINVSGKVIGFGGRAISPEDNPKYLNSPENAVFKKKDNLYGLGLARKYCGKEGFIILVEGYMDVVSLSQAGVGNVVASLGTALTDEQARLLHRYTKDVILSYDADRAGRAAAVRGLGILRKHDSRVRVLHVDSGKDPDEYIKEHGKDEFLKLLDTAKPFGDYMLDSRKEKYDITSDEDKVRYIKDLSDVFSQMDPMERDVYSGKLARELGVSKSAIERELSIDEGTDEKKNEHARSDSGASRELAPREPLIIKICSEDPAYFEKVKENKGIIETEIAKTVMNSMYHDYTKNGNADLYKAIDRLSEDDRKALSSALSGVVISSENFGKTMDDVVINWKIDELERKEKEINLSLSLAGDDTGGERVTEFQKELIEIRNEISKLKQIREEGRK